MLFKYDLKVRAFKLGKETIFILDSISYITQEHKDCIVISASHGGLSSGRYALEYPPKLTVFNDAGVGKDQAGIAALKQLELQEVAALAVSAQSARIGDGEDTWVYGLISHVNKQAQELGLQEGVLLQKSVINCFADSV